MNEIKSVLGNGYIKYIGHMGSDETFVEAARMSTGKGFYDWFWAEDTHSDCICAACNTHHLVGTLPKDDDDDPICTNCWNTRIRRFSNDDEWKEIGCPTPKLLGRKGEKRDLSLLETLYANGHQTPFEMGELCIEVKAPIFVFREWHRHRTQSYNEFSARYSQMPNEHYVPELSRIQKQSKTNKQGSGEAFPPEAAAEVASELSLQQGYIYHSYDKWVSEGVAKEVARINTPVSRMSKMRAKTDIRNWLAFLLLRMDLAAQWEIRQYANEVASIISKLFPRTFELFLEHSLLGTRFSRTEMRFLTMFYGTVSGAMDPAERVVMSGVAAEIASTAGMTQKQMDAFMKKLTTSKETDYKLVLEKL